MQIFCLYFFVLIFSITAFAGEEAPKPDSLPKPVLPPVDVVGVIETATASKTKIEDIPHMTHEISAERIVNRLSAPSLVDALEETPGVLLQKTSAGQGSPFLRGFTGYQTLMMIDGVRFNNSTFRSGPNQYWRTIDPLSLERLEVAMGPFSTLWGSDAVGGTVNAITRDPSWGDGKHVWQGIDWGGKSYYRGATGERSNMGHQELEGAYKDKLAFIFSGSYKDFDDYRSGGGVIEGSGFSEFSGDAKIKYRIDKNYELTFLSQHFRQQGVPRTEQTKFNPSFHGTARGTEIRRDSDQFRSLAYVQLDGKDLNSVVDKLTVNASYQNHQEERDRKRSNNRTDLSGFDVDTFGLSVKARTDTPIGAINYGFDHYHDNVDSFQRDFNADGSPRSNGIQGPLADNANYDLFGAFLQTDTWLLNQRLNIVAGLRYSYARAEADQIADPVDTTRSFDLTEDWNSLVATGRVLYKIDEAKRFSIFGGASQAFRAPSLSDLTSFDATSAVETPSPGLDPEEYTQFELGLNGSHKGLKFRVTGYYTLIDSQITQSPTGNDINNTPEVVKNNDGEGWLYGVEAQASYTFLKHYELWSDFTFQKGRTDQRDFQSGEVVRAPLTRLMPPTGHLGFRYTTESQRWWVEAVGAFSGRQDDLALRDRVDSRRIPPGGTPGYALLHIRGGARLRENLTLTGGIQNVTDQNYRVHGSGSNGVGINFYLGLEWKF
jgi:hemoglobin/transferrin/lactoferrin receptor protein